MMKEIRCKLIYIISSFTRIISKLGEHFIMLIIAGLLGGIIYLLLVNHGQQEKFLEDGEFYYEKLNEINNKIDTLGRKMDFQTTNINKTIDDNFNKGFDCNLTK